MRQVDPENVSAVGHLPLTVTGGSSSRVKLVEVVWIEVLLEWSSS